MIATQYINLNMVPSGYPPVVYMSQYDVRRPIGFVVHASGSAPDLDSYAVTLEGTRSDGTPVVTDVTTDGNVCAFETTATMTNKKDRYPAQIVVRDGLDRIASIPVIMVVVKAAMDENSEEIKEDKSLFQQYTDTVSSLIANIRAQLAAEAKSRYDADTYLERRIKAEEATRYAEDEKLQTQIDEMIAPSGEAPNPTEIVNARIGADGVTYDTLGEAIRTQIGNINANMAYTQSLSVSNGILTVKGGIYGTIPKKMTATLEPQQSGSGTPSATNIRPFINFDGIGTSHSTETTPSGGTGPAPSSPFYGGTQDCLTGRWTLPYIHYGNYDGADISGLRWWSDRDPYVPGTNPSVGAFVVIEDTAHASTASGNAWGADPMGQGENLYRMTANTGSTSVDFALSMEVDITNIGDRVDELGGEVTDLKNKIEQSNDGKESIAPSPLTWNRGYINSSGALVATNANATPLNAPVLWDAGKNLYIIPNGMNVEVQTYTYSGVAYTRTSSNIYTANTTLNFESNTYLAYHVNKTGVATLPLSDVTALFLTDTRVAKSIAKVADDLSNESSETDADFADVNEKIQNLSKMVDSTAFKEGASLTIPYYDGDGYIKVENIADTIYTGSYNIADLLQFVDNASINEYGLTGTIQKNHAVISGTASANVYISLNTGKVYTTGSDIRNEGRKYLLPNVSGYIKAFFEKGSATIVMQNLTSGNIAVLSALSNEAQITFSDQCGQVYLYWASGTAVDIDIYIGLYTSWGNSNYRQQKTSSVSIISEDGIYPIADRTWSATTQTVTYMFAKSDFPRFVNDGRKVVWMGDSISQGGELPNTVAKLMQMTIYDVSFSGAPLTYSAQYYQDTGFMAIAEMIADGDFTDLSTAIEAIGGETLAERRAHLATLEALDFDTVTDIVVLAGTNDLNNDYVPTIDTFKTGMRAGIESILTAYPGIILHFISPIWRGDIVTDKFGRSLADIVTAEQEVCAEYNIPFYDLYHNCMINTLTQGRYLNNDHVHPNATGEAMIARKCAQILLTN